MVFFTYFNFDAIIIFKEFLGSKKSEKNLKLF